jgi:complexin-1/2
MASFVMKQMIGNQLNDVTSSLGGNKEEGEKTEGGEDPEVIAARKEQEERRKEKHRKMELEREKVRRNL